MADGYARAGGSPGVCLSIGGPGAANMLTAAQAAQLDSSPVLFITGDVPLSLADRGAFQDAGDRGTRDVALFQRAVAFSRSLRDRSQLCDALAEAWAALTAGHCAHLSIPVDVLRARHSEPQARLRSADGRPTGRTEATIVLPERLTSLLREARRILVMAGRRLCTRAGAESLRRFVETHSVPVVTTLAAKGLLPEDHPLALGNCGFAGSQRANGTLIDGRYDLLLMVGADFNERDSLAWNERIGSGRTIVRLDASERPYCSPIAADLEYLDTDPAAWLDALRRLSPNDLGGPRPAPEHWFRRPSAGRSDAHRRQGEDTLLARDVVDTLRSAMRDDAMLVVDGGMVRAFAGQGWPARHPFSFHSATSTAPTGWAIPAAVGLQLAEPQRQVVALTGDGCMLMHGIEIATAVRYRTAIVVVVLDNGGHGAVLRRAPTREIESIVRTAAVDWPAFARSLGAEGVSVRSVRQLASEVTAGLAGEGPRLIHVPTSAHEPYADAEHVFLSYSSYLHEE